MATTKRLIVVILLLTSCATTKNANTRAWASQKLSNCVRVSGGSMAFEKQCIEENKTFCKSQGLEGACGLDGLYGRMPLDR
jgi:hypothetical protein